jgi:ABC-type branched-subunit amino acid transport system substrate-binding protein
VTNIGKISGRAARVLLGSVLLAAALAGCSGGGSASGPLRIGVMLPLTGGDAVGYRAPLEWARDNVNAAGGIGGRPVELVFRDIARESVTSVASDFAKDSTIVAAIGPDTSATTREAAATFTKAHKVLVSPSATSADLFRAFRANKPQYFWRPVESDIAQVRALLQMSADGGGRSVSLVAGDSEYGATFFDWLGFLTTEANVRVAQTVRYDQDGQSCEGPMGQALAAGADVLIAVPDDAKSAVCMATAWRASGSKGRLLFSDAGQNASLVQALGPGAEGLEGTGLAPDPGNGFTDAHTARFHTPPTPYAANTYDSLLLLAYGLQRSGAKGGATLATSIGAVVRGTDQPVGWDRPDVAQALRAIAAGRVPAIRGAVGPWTFDKNSGIELTASTYERWRVTNGVIAVTGYTSTADAPTAKQGVSESDPSPTPGKGQTAVGGTYEPPPKSGTWALLVAASFGWDNYRHQADMLAQYQRLRANGVPADHIVVVMADDLARNKRNKRPGTVINAVGGPNLYHDVQADYSPTRITADDLFDILQGRATPDTPKVLQSGPTDDVYLYMAGHGNQNGLYLGLGDVVPAQNQRYSVVSPAALQGAVDAMAAHHQYRRLLVTVEACEGGVLGEHLDAPGALLLSAADPVEDSLSANYDASLDTWLADQFSYQYWTASAAATTSVSAVYQRVYLDVDGSHPSAYGTQFGNPAAVPIGEFLSA